MIRFDRGQRKKPPRRRRPVCPGCRDEAIRLRCWRAAALYEVCMSCRVPVRLVSEIAKRCGLSLAQLHRAGLDLSDAGLAVLSACDSGLLVALRCDAEARIRPGSRL